MQFSISASGSTKQEALKALELQRDPVPDHESLKNQVIEHVAAHIDALPADATGISVSVSGYVGYTLPAATQG